MDESARAAIEVIEEPVVTAFRAAQQELEIPGRERRVQRAPGHSQPGQITLEMGVRDVFPCGDPSDPVSYRARDHETRLQRADHGYIE